MTGELTVFRVTRDPDRTRVEGTGELLGWGVKFPCGRCHVDWNRDAYPPDDRLEGPHVSLYETLDDVRQGTGGTVETVHVIEFADDGEVTETFRPLDEIDVEGDDG